MSDDGREEDVVVMTYTARYSETEAGYSGELLEWDEVTAEGTTLEGCRKVLHETLNKSIEMYKRQAKEVPVGGAMIEWISVEI